MLDWLKSGNRPAATKEGKRVISDYVSSHPSETRNTYNYSPGALGDALRSDYMSQRPSGIISSFLNPSDAKKGMNLSDYLKSSQAQSIADEYGGFFSPRQGYEQWTRGETVPETVDTRNDYQIGMNVLRNKYPGAYAEKFPISEFMMSGFPKLAMGTVGSMAGLPSFLAYAPSTIDQGVSIYNKISDMFSDSDDEEEIPWWKFWNKNEKARGGLASLNGGGSYWTSPKPTTSSTPTVSFGQSLHGGSQYKSPSTSSVPVNPVNPYFGGSNDSDYDWSPPQHPESENLVAALSLASAGIKNLAGDKVGKGTYTLTDTLNVSGQGAGTVFYFDETGQIDSPDPAGPGPGPGPGPGGGYHWEGKRFGSGSQMLDEAFENVSENLGSSAMKEQGKEQFNTQFMASQLLHDLSRKGYDSGGLADMSENALGEFDTARSTWKWKYDNKINELMDGGFTLKEAIDQLWNKGWGMPYKGFSLKERT